VRRDTKRCPLPLGIPIVPGDHGGNEDLLLNLFSRRHLAMISSEDRTRTVEEASTEAERAFGTMSAPSETIIVMDAAVREKVQAISS